MNENLNTKNHQSKDAEIKELKKELKTLKKTIESLKETLVNNNNMLHDIIIEKKELTKKIQEYDHKLVDTKLKQYQKLQEDHQKIIHRLQVTKKQLDKTNQNIKILNRKNEELERVIMGLESRGILDYIRGKYPESYQEYKK